MSRDSNKAPSYTACASMIDNLKALIPNTSNFAPKNHTHDQYVTTSYLASELKQTRQWVLDNFKSK